MSDPIVFISHHRVKDGQLDGLRRHLAEGTGQIERDKPRTLLFQTYLCEDGTEVSFVHAFADAEALDLHVEGAEERAAAAHQFIEPQSFEIYGRPSERFLAMMRQSETSGAVVRVHPTPGSGFLRLASTAPRDSR
jgi:hypothetical protein